MKCYIEKEKLTEDTLKQKNGKWINKGDSGETHGEFKTKKAADAQRKAIFASGWHESLDEALGDYETDLDNYDTYDADEWFFDKPIPGHHTRNHLKNEWDNNNLEAQGDLLYPRTPRPVQKIDLSKAEEVDINDEFFKEPIKASCFRKLKRIFGDRLSFGKIKNRDGVYVYSKQNPTKYITWENDDTFDNYTPGEQKKYKEVHTNILKVVDFIKSELGVMPIADESFGRLTFPKPGEPKDLISEDKDLEEEWRDDDYHPVVKRYIDDLKRRDFGLYLKFRQDFRHKEYRYEEGERALDEIIKIRNDCKSQWVKSGEVSNEDIEKFEEKIKIPATIAAMCCNFKTQKYGEIKDVELAAFIDPEQLKQEVEQEIELQASTKNRLRQEYRDKLRAEYNELSEEEQDEIIQSAIILALDPEHPIPDYIKERIDHFGEITNIKRAIRTKRSPSFENFNQLSEEDQEELIRWLKENVQSIKMTIPLSKMASVDGGDNQTKRSDRIDKDKVRCCLKAIQNLYPNSLSAKAVSGLGSIDGPVFGIQDKWGFETTVSVGAKNYKRCPEKFKNIITDAATKHNDFTRLLIIKYGFDFGNSNEACTERVRADGKPLSQTESLSEKYMDDEAAIINRAKRDFANDSYFMDSDEFEDYCNREGIKYSWELWCAYIGALNND